MGNLIRDNKLLLSKLAKSIPSPDDTHGMILHCSSGVSDGMSVLLPFYSKNNNRIQIVIPIEKEDIEFVEVKDSVYICLNTDRMCHMNRARFVGNDMLRDRVVTEYKSFDGFFKDYFQYNVEQYIRDDFERFQSGIHEGAQFKTFMLVLEFLNSETDYTYYDNAIDDNHEFELAIQYIIDNHMIEEVISYNESVMRKFFYESLEKCVESPNAFNVARDGYYENGLLGVVKIDFKNLKYIAFDGVSTYDKITFSKSSNKICGGDLDYVFNGRIGYLGNVVRRCIKICKAPGVNRYTGKLVGVSGLLSHKSFELSAHWRGV